jgi:hypothetical protein
VTVAGVDLGGSKIAGVLLDDSGAVRGEIWQEHRIAGPDEAVDLIAEVVGELTARDLAAHELSARELSTGNGAAQTPAGAHRSGAVGGRLAQPRPAGGADRREPGAGPHTARPGARCRPRAPGTPH